MFSFKLRVHASDNFHPPNCFTPYFIISLELQDEVLIIVNETIKF